MRLLNEHQKLVREVEKWSSVASMQSEGHEPSSGSGAVGAMGNATDDENCEDEEEPAGASAASISASSCAAGANDK